MATTPQLIPLGSLAAQTTSPDLSSLVSDLFHSSRFLLMDLNRRTGQSLYYKNIYLHHHSDDNFDNKMTDNDDKYNDDNDDDDADYEGWGR